MTSKLAAVALRVCLCVGLIPLSAACSVEEEASVVAVSYNAGLARGFVPGAVERVPLVADAIAGADTDVICLQEVWFDEDVQAVRDVAGAAFPHDVFPEPAGPGEPGPAPCTMNDLTPLLDCVEANGCDTVCGDEQIDCVLGNCSAEFQALNDDAPDCSQCLQANVGKPVDDIITACTTESAEYAFGGSFGLGLMSRHPILSSDFLVLDSTTNRRGVVYAQLDTALGPVHAFCTHLTAVFDEDVIPYPRAEGSWKQEQRSQIDTILSWVDEKAAGGDVVVMGDFNTGPEGADYVGEHPAHFEALLAGGLAAPYVTAGEPCTFCETNPLVGADHEGSSVIDHVLVSGFKEPTMLAERVLDEPTEVPICDMQSDAALSDHYGVRVSVAAVAPTE